MDHERAEFGSGGFELPPSNPPSATAPYDVRAVWSDLYVRWVIAETPQDGASPPDARATHRYEVEFNSCVADPQAYMRAVEAALPPEMLH